MCLDNGQGVPVDLREAARYFKMTVDQGHAAARQGWKRVVDIELIVKSVIRSRR